MERHQFELNDIIVNWDQPPKSLYTIEFRKEKKRIHWGQRKLGLALVQFMTNYWDPNKTPYPKIVYAGAAPGSNIKLGVRLFPRASWYLYDPSPIKIQKMDNIKIYQKLFTDQDAEQWKNRNDVFFISDIRSIGIDNIRPDQYEAGIWKDMLTQQQWVKIIKPQWAQLKFRLPYSKRGFPDLLPYMDGVLYHGIWAPQSSTESRLVPNQNLEEALWSIEKYENHKYYFNSHIRENCVYYNPFYSKNDYRYNYPIYSSNNMYETELTNDYDSRAETQVWINYLNKFTQNKSLLNDVERLADALTAVINDDLKFEKWTTLKQLKGVSDEND